MKNKRLYQWWGYDQNNHIQQGEIAAISLQQAHQQLIFNGVIATKIKAGAKLSSRQWQEQSLMIITRQLATMLQAGLPLMSCLQLLISEHPQPVWRYLLNEIKQQLAQGHPLSQILLNYPHIFPALYQQLIATGELTGQLDHCFQQIAIQQEKRITLQNKVRKALRYPLFVLCVAMLVALLMLVLVLPEFTQVYQNFGAKLPYFTQLLIDLSDFIQDYGLIITSVFLLISYLYIEKLHKQTHWQHREQKLLLKLPLIKQLIHFSTLANIFRVLSMTQQAGLPLLSGLAAAEKAAGNISYQQLIKHVLQQVEQGQPLYRTLQQLPQFPALCYQLISIGEESGTLDAMIEKLAQIYEQETENTTENLSQKIEPLLMLVLGILIGGLVIAMYLPIFQLGNVVG